MALAAAKALHKAPIADLLDHMCDTRGFANDYCLAMRRCWSWRTSIATTNQPGLPAAPPMDTPAFSRAKRRLIWCA